MSIVIGNTYTYVNPNVQTEGWDGATVRVDELLADGFAYGSLYRVTNLSLGGVEGAAFTDLLEADDQPEPEVKEASVVIGETYVFNYDEGVPVSDEDTWNGAKVRVEHTAGEEFDTENARALAEALYPDHYVVTKLDDDQPGLVAASSLTPVS